MINESFDYVEYLDRKKAIDNRSLNKAVWSKLATWIHQDDSKPGSKTFLEIGAGIGTMIERLLEHELISDCRYFALEPEAGFRDDARRRLQALAAARALEFQETTHCWRLRGGEVNLEIEWVAATAEKIQKLFARNSFDLLISHAVVDLLPVPTLFPGILQTLRPGGAFYFSLNFSGNTDFFPVLENDSEIARKYHADMDSRFPGLDWVPSQTGIKLPDYLKTQGCALHAAGDSDWVLHAEDTKFIQNILDTIRKALADHPGMDEWYLSRLAQLEAGSLQLRISNRDCFGLKQIS